MRTQRTCFQTMIELDEVEYQVRADFTYYGGFISRDRSEPDEPAGWNIEEYSVEILDDLGWHDVSEANFDKVCDYLVENFEEKGDW